MINRKSHTGYRLVPTSMTLNDLERRNSSYFAFFSPNSVDFQSDYVTVVVDRPIISVKYCIPVPVFHVFPKLTHSAARSLCDSWASCIDCNNRPRCYCSRSSF